jgi:hypothetical protein
MMKTLLALIIAPLALDAQIDAHSPLQIPRLETPPTIDGDLSDWKEVAHSDGVWDMRRISHTAPYALDRGARNRLTDHGDEGPIEDDLSARYYSAWDDTFFYFGAEVRDNVNDIDDPEPADKRWYFRDAICWFMEAPRDRAPELFAQGDNAFCFTASTQQKPAHAWWRHGAPGIAYAEEPIPQATWQVRFTGHAGDFVLEARVEMNSTFGVSDPRWRPPQVGDEYSMEIVHTDPDGKNYGGHFMIYGNGDDDSTWRPAVLTGPQMPLRRLEE